MSYGPPSSGAEIPISLEPQAGWHCSHLFYRLDRGVLQAIGRQSGSGEIAAGRDEWLAVLDPESSTAPARMQVSIVSGHKADFGIMLMDPNPLKIDAIQQRLLAGRLGPALIPSYSFTSMTEVSEYVPSVEQYAERLVAEGEERGSPGYEAKVRGYAAREPMMRKQRLTPDLPTWPATCFYPMNKKRKVGENWFLLPFTERNRLMAEHARSGMAFAGKVSQLITVGVGLEDWEWGVTLWAKNPEFLKDIVYRMRFDEASARYAEFGPFYVSYVVTASQMFEHCRIGLP
jgi:chlorite dismutase